MKLFKHKKGLVGGLIAVMLVLFLFAVMSLVYLTMWNNYNGVIQDMPEDFVDNSTKQEIDDLSIYLLWTDNIFVLLYIVLVAAYLISSVTLPVDRPILMIVFAFSLILITILAMLFSNAWSYMISQPNFIEAAEELGFMTFVLRYFPVITFFIGVTGGLLFYSRSRVFTAQENRGDTFE